MKKKKRKKIDALMCMALDAHVDQFAAMAFDESKHPRGEKGSHEGGKFVSQPHSNYEPQEGHRVKVKSNMIGGGKVGVAGASTGSRGFIQVMGVNSGKHLGYYHASDLLYHKDDLPLKAHMHDQRR